MGNASIDTEAARELGITVAGTGGTPTHTAELTWALILALARQVPAGGPSACARAAGSTPSASSSPAARSASSASAGSARRSRAIGEAFGMEVIAWSQNMDTLADQGGAAAALATS